MSLNKLMVQSSLDCCANILDRIREYLRASNLRVHEEMLKEGQRGNILSFFCLLMILNATLCIYNLLLSQGCVCMCVLVGLVACSDKSECSVFCVFRKSTKTMSGRYYQHVKLWNGTKNDH